MGQKVLLFGGVGLVSYGANQIPPETLAQIIAAAKDVIMFLLGAFLVPSKGVQIKRRSDDEKE